jgi:hypothetical protein
VGAELAGDRMLYVERIVVELADRAVNAHDLADCSTNQDVAVIPANGHAVGVAFLFSTPTGAS